jgi:polyisoprenoid-binding protein YceI
MKNVLLILVALMSMQMLSAQRYFTKTAEIAFYSDAPLEKIEAINNKGTTVIDIETGAVQWSALIKAFKFEKALMEEHFNENYMESTKFPKATFKGKIEDISSIDFNTSGEYSAKAKGQLTIHGVSKEIEADVQFIVASGGVTAASAFKVKLADFNIEVPSVVSDNISDVVDITLKASYQPMPSK